MKRLTQNFKLAQKSQFDRTVPKDFIYFLIIIIISKPSQVHEIAHSCAFVVLRGCSLKTGLSSTSTRPKKFGESVSFHKITPPCSLCGDGHSPQLCLLIKRSHFLIKSSNIIFSPRSQFVLQYDNFFFKKVGKQLSGINSFIRSELKMQRCTAKTARLLLRFPVQTKKVSLH